MKRLISLILPVCFLFALLSGCGGQRQGGPAVVSSLPASRDAEFIFDSAYEAPQPDVMGKMDFALDPNGKNKIAYANKAVTKTVKSSDGSTWKITIPDNALEPGGQADITVTSMSGVSNSEIDAGFSGVLLEPQGLKFIKPVRLEYTGTNKAEHLVFLGNSDGENLNFLPSTDTDNGFVTEITHFSSAYTNNGKLTPDQVLGIAQKLIEWAEERLKDLRINVPDIDLEHIDYAAIKKTRDDFVFEEFDYMQSLVAMDTMLTKSGIDNRELARKLGELLFATYERFYKKMDAFIKEYRDEPEQAFIMIYANYMNFMLIAYMPLAYFEDHALAPAEQKKWESEMDDNREKYSEVSLAWAQELWDHEMDEIKNEHNYRVIKAGMLMAEDFPNWEVSFHENELVSEFVDSLAFKLEFTGEINGSLDGVDSTWKIKGEVPLDFDVEDNRFVWHGAGECSFSGYETDGNVKLDPSPAPVDVKINLLNNAEDYFIDVKINHLSPDMLVYTDEDGNKFQFGMFEAGLPNFFMEYYDGAGYKFRLELNKGEEKITKEMDGKLDSATAHYEFSFIHQPLGK